MLSLPQNKELSVYNTKWREEPSAYKYPLLPSFEGHPIQFNNYQEHLHGVTNEQIHCNNSRAHIPVSSSERQLSSTEKARRVYKYGEQGENGR
jgi:hypothetical protein